MRHFRPGLATSNGCNFITMQIDRNAKLFEIAVRVVVHAMTIVCRVVLLRFPKQLEISWVAAKHYISEFFLIGMIKATEEGMRKGDLKITGGCLALQRNAYVSEGKI